MRFMRPDEANRPGMAAWTGGREHRRDICAEGDQYAVELGRAASRASDGRAFLLGAMQRKVREQIVQSQRGGVRPQLRTHIFLRPKHRVDPKTPHTRVSHLS